MKNLFHESWTVEAQSICRSAIERHGGWTAWENLDSIKLKPLYLKGLLSRLKGYPKTFTLPEYIEVFAKNRRVIFHNYPGKGSQGIFENGNVQIIEGGQVIADVPNARRTFRGISKYRLWKHLDGLYFFGYAWVTYISVPFVFPSCELMKYFKHPESGQIWDALTVRFPSDFDTHSAEQTFYFDKTGLLQRHDYCAQIVGSWATGAHYSSDYIVAEGIQVARQRRVCVRIGRQALPITVLAADLNFSFEKS
jgi:hypothetical protein